MKRNPHPHEATKGQGMSLADRIDALGIRPWASDFDKPSLNSVPERGPLAFKDGKQVLDYLSNAAERERYEYYVTMKESAHPERDTRMPPASEQHKWTEWLACNDNYVHGTKLMDPRHLNMLVYWGSNQAGMLDFVMNVSTYCKISLDDHLYTLFHVFSDGRTPSLFRDTFGDGYATILKEFEVVSDMVAVDTNMPSLRQKHKFSHLLTKPYYGVVQKGIDVFRRIVDLTLVHRCRPLAARAIYRDDEAESPMAQTIYGENTPLTRHLISRSNARSGISVVSIDPVWWWPNQEIRSKVNYKYAPPDVSTSSWGWLLRAGVPPVVLCEHKLTKAEAGAYVIARVPSWAHKINQKEISMDEPDRGLYFSSDPKGAIAGSDILRFRYGPQIKALKDSTDTTWEIRNSIDRLIDHTEDPIVAEWALKKIHWLLKEQTVHGPRGQVYKFQPISRVDEIRPEDIGGNTDTSPEKVFERVTERMKREIEAGNLKGFSFPEWKHPLHPEVTYLSNSVALQTEGKLMHHCCGSYSKKCEQGETFIFHVGAPAPFGSTVEAVYDEKILSFGVTKGVRSKLVVYQHFGMRNSTPDDADKKIVKEWVAMCKPKKAKKTNPPPRWRDIVLCPPMRG